LLLSVDARTVRNSRLKDLAWVFFSRRFLRLFSSGGNQCQVVWLKGEPVTMVGRGRFLAVFYHASAPQTDATQQLGYTLWDASSFRVLSQGPVACLSRGSSLSWVGFSNDLSLLAMDSDGMLSMLVSTGDKSPDLRLFEWAPVLDTVGLRKSADDLHWPVTVYDGKLVCVPLKGGNTFPDATRRPVTTTLGLRMPLAKSVVARK
jgi:chromosome transmission fidelity protein 4